MNLGWGVLGIVRCVTFALVAGQHRRPSHALPRIGVGLVCLYTSMDTHDTRLPLLIPRSHLSYLLPTARPPPPPSFCSLPPREAQQRLQHAHPHAALEEDVE